MNLNETTPIIGRDRLTAVETAVGLDETALFGTSNAVSDCDVSLTALSTPPTPTAVVGGTAGTTSYTYLISDVGNGGTAAPSSTVTNTVGNATLSAMNSIAVTFVGLAGHTYNLIRSVGGSATGTIYTATLPTVAQGGLANQVVSFTDTGAVTPTGIIPTANTTGALVPAGPIIGTAISAMGVSLTTISTTATTGSLTGAQVQTTLLLFTGGAAATYNMPTAQQMVAALPGAKVNSGFKFLLRNANSGSLTLAATTGVTSAAGNTLAVVSLHVREYYIQFTNVTAASEAYTVYSGPDSLY